MLWKCRLPVSVTFWLKGKTCQYARFKNKFDYKVNVPLYTMITNASDVAAFYSAAGDKGAFLVLCFQLRGESKEKLTRASRWALRFYCQSASCDNHLLQTEWVHLYPGIFQTCIFFYNYAFFNEVITFRFLIKTKQNMHVCRCFLGQYAGWVFFLQSPSRQRFWAPSPRGDWGEFLPEIND